MLRTFRAKGALLTTKREGGGGLNPAWIWPYGYGQTRQKLKIKVSQQKAKNKMQQHVTSFP
jgi:hypothetical protein